MKILHVLETSIPELVGYTVRGRYIVAHQRQLGLEPLVVTSPFFRGTARDSKDLIDGIVYFRSNHIRRPDRGQGRLAAYWTRLQMLLRYREFVAEIVRRERPAVIHAHSSYTNGLAAWYASQCTGIPFIYELRTLWGESAVVEDGLDPASLKYRAVWRLELGVMRAANRVVAISKGIRDAIIERGIDPEKIAIIPNGVDTSVFAPRPSDPVLIENLSLTGCFVIGFIGSLRRLEGLELLVEAFNELWRQNPRARLVIVGDGPERTRIERLVKDAGLENTVRCLGLVPHDQILRYYSIMDILVYPRIDARINQAVTPLKPLEAMAMGKACLASDVGGLKELVEGDVTGILFDRGNSKDLTKKMLLLAADTDFRNRIATQGQATVRKEREWSTLALRYADIYRWAGAAG